MLKAIVFDFGNVLYDLDIDLFNQNLSVLLEDDFKNGYPETLVNTVIKYDSGQINTETFIWNIQNYKNGQLDPRSIINNWNSLLKSFPPNRWSFLAELKKKYKLFLLSNINELHLETAYKHIHKVHGLIDFETRYFDGVFYSHLIKKAKPAKEVYKFLEEVTGIAGNELIFIDDREENVIGARKSGWNAVLHNPKHNIEEVFQNYIEKFQ